MPRHQQEQAEIDDPEMLAHHPPPVPKAVDKEGPTVPLLQRQCQREYDSSHPEAPKEALLSAT